MIALDSSALLAIVLEEPERGTFETMLARHDCVIGAPTVLEAQMAASSRGGTHGNRSLRHILFRPTVEIIDFTAELEEIAFEAFERYGRGRHPAKLNFGDCMAYAVAKRAKAPLLYKGDDFSKTDIPAAVPQGPK
jgi:ribonuclease VapC